ncbi:PLP-dependent aminotransferase family protein [Ruegeria sp. SCP11]|uniref:aminotransferase-like domain-containing protein n=1 Tax=Ruegeria sp. SCP11 TaxID=3141378 RepID=UPI00333C103F
MRAKYKDVAADLVRDIRSGTLKPGDRLPTHRELAHRHGLSLGTATKVFSEMEAMGLTIGEVGRGTFVRMNADARAMEFSYETPGEAVVDFSKNHLVLPEQDGIFKDAIAKVLADPGCDVLDYRNNPGAEYDRLTAWRWLNEDREKPIDSHQAITICSGGQHALMLALMATCRPGQVVAVERLTYPMVRLACEMLRLDVVEVDADSEGIIPESFARLCQKHDVSALFSIPNVQNPTSTTLPMERRSEIVKIAKTNDVMVVEDDAYGFLLEQPPTSFAELAPDRTLYIRTLSKSWAPGLRVCFLVSPDSYKYAVDRAQRASVWMNAPLMVSVASEIIASGQYKAVVRAKRKEVFKRQAILRRVLDGMEVVTEPQSMHVLLPLPSNARQDWVVEALAEANVLVSPASLFAAKGERSGLQNGLRLCIGAPRDRATTESALITIRTVVQASQNKRAWG